MNRFYIHFLEWQDAARVGDQGPQSRALMSDEDHRRVDSDIVYKQVEIARRLNDAGRFQIICHPFEPESAHQIWLWHNEPQFKAVQKCYFLWLETRIDPFGDVIPCLYITTPAGNIMTDKFSDLWRGETLTSIRREIQRGLRPVCQKCCKLSRHWQNYLVHI